MFNPNVFAAVAIAASVWSTQASPIEKRASPAPAAAFNELHRAAQLSSAAYSACQGSAFGVNITHQINNVATDTQGYIGYSTSNQRISVVMRGSSAPLDFINDIDTTPVTPSLSGVAFPAGVKVAAGIYLPWASVHDEVITNVRSLVARYPTYTLETTGHSLGGSLTYLSFIALAQNFPAKTVLSNALAPFQIGNQAFANFGTAQQKTGGSRLWRGDNAGDGVPNLYPQFVHYGTEYYGSGTAASTLVCNGERDLQCSAGNGAYGITAQHVSSFGVTMAFAGCA